MDNFLTGAFIDEAPQQTNQPAQQQQPPANVVQIPADVWERQQKQLMDKDHMIDQQGKSVGILRGVNENLAKAPDPFAGIFGSVPQPQPQQSQQNYGIDEFDPLAILHKNEMQNRQQPIQQQQVSVGQVDPNRLKQAIADTVAQTYNQLEDNKYKTNMAIQELATGFEREYPDIVNNPNAVQAVFGMFRQSIQNYVAQNGTASLTPEVLRQTYQQIVPNAANMYRSLQPQQQYLQQGYQQQPQQLPMQNYQQPQQQYMQQPGQVPISVSPYGMQPNYNQAEQFYNAQESNRNPGTPIQTLNGGQLQNIQPGQRVVQYDHNFINKSMEDAVNWRKGIQSNQKAHRAMVNYPSLPM